jgi:predicted RNA binding protein YcfA (HicA-like mRNA interferase family)
VPKQWPPLTADEIRDCLKALGWVFDRRESSHEVWVHETTRQIAVVDVKWNPISSSLHTHLVTAELKLKRLVFYGATKRSARKIGIR